jgi:hypothetical protein
VGSTAISANDGNTKSGRSSTGADNGRLCTKGAACEVSYHNVWWACFAWVVGDDSRREKPKTTAQPGFGNNATVTIATMPTNNKNKIHCRTWCGVVKASAMPYTANPPPITQTKYRVEHGTCLVNSVALSSCCL